MCRASSVAGTGLRTCTDTSTAHMHMPSTCTWSCSGQWHTPQCLHPDIGLPLGCRRRPLPDCEHTAIRWSNKAAHTEADCRICEGCAHATQRVQHTAWRTWGLERVPNPAPAVRPSAALASSSADCVGVASVLQAPSGPRPVYVRAGAPPASPPRRAAMPRS
jgi:hypothetical protein